MSDKTTYFLILEDSVVVSKLLTQRLKGEFPGAEILPAFSLAEARNLLKEIVFDIFILDIQLPDGSGIDFLCEVQTQFPNSRAIILTATRVPEYREIALALGALRFMEKPVKIKELSGIIRDMLDAKEEKAQPEMSFRGTLTSLTPMNLIQLKCLSQASLILEFVIPNGQSGRIFFLDGQIIHAETGALEGEKAFNRIVSWKGGSVSELPAAADCKRTIDCDWNGLLLNAAQAMDEVSSGADPEPEPAPPVVAAKSYSGDTASFGKITRAASSAQPGA
ncbi:MAG: response regulator [Verrucomicrobia bacterium]|nr:response regulator [Verrucomicrobiota bacterium]